ncbi:MAG: hypothetical protein FWE06_04550 [Oscillospiraceae bacterium]|nr:hypothetical protein [Oscillospiraceae bacterium]
MKKVILVILAVVLVAALLAVGILLASRGENDVIDHTPTPITTPTETPEPTHTEPSYEYAEALELLQEEFGEDATFTRRPDLDEWVTDIPRYAFLVTYPMRGIPRYLYAWVHVVYGWVFVEEEAITEFYLK